MLDIRLSDGQGRGILADINEYKDKTKGLVVSTRPYDFQEFRRLVFTNSEFGENMNVNVVFGATPVPIHDGADHVYWTYAAVNGTAPTLNSTTRAYAGTQSIRWNNPTAISTFALNRGSDLVLTGYKAITMYIYIVSGWDSGENMSIYGVSGATQVGLKANINDYINLASLNVWQKVTIPLTAMSLVGSTINGVRLRMENRVGPASPEVYIDLIQIEETATADGTFEIYPDPNSWFYLQELRFFMADVYTSTLLNATVPLLDHTKLLGVSELASGIFVKAFRGNDLRYNLNFKNLADFIKYGANISAIGSSSTETWLALTILYETPIILQAEHNDYASITISEDLSGLTKFSCTARGAVRFTTEVPEENKYINIY